jgi:predicted nucleic-acid-binding Zn-ribbon protein
MQNKKFAAVSCVKCGYTEMYKQNAGGLMGNVFDMLSN